MCGNYQGESGYDRNHYQRCTYRGMGPPIPRASIPWGVLAVLAAAVLAVILVTFAAGCAANGSTVKNSVPAVGTSVDIASAFTVSAENHNQQIRPHADKEGQVLVSVVASDHQKVISSLVDAKNELAAVQHERDQLVQANNRQAATIKAKDAKITADESTWGFRAEVWAKRLFWILIGLGAIHLLAGGLAAVLPLFFPAAVAAVPILKIVGAICNPIAWIQFTFDHIHLSRCTQAVTASANGAAKAIEQIVTPRIA